MKQTLNKLLFVLGLVVLVNLIPSIASADSFMVGDAYVSVNVDASTPSSTIASASVDCYYCNSVSAQIDASIWNPVSFSYGSSQTILNMGAGGLSEYGSTVFDLNGYLSGNYYINFNGVVQGFPFSNNVSFYLNESPKSVSVSASPSSIVQGTSNNITVSWSSSGATYCDGNNGLTGLSGSHTFYGVSDSMVYSIYCYGIDNYSNYNLVAYGDASVSASVPPPPPPLPPALGVQIFANGKPAETVAYNSTANITWSTTGNPTSCVCSYSSPNGSGSCGSGIGSVVSASGVPSNLKSNTTFSVTCTDVPIGVIPPADPVYTYTGYVCPSYYPSCFIADTVVQMADGTTKNIQDVNIGDVLKGEKTNNKVLGFHDPKLNSKKLYSFNGGRYFVTAEHPFKTIDGWKSINPSLTAEENIGIIVTELKVGDTLITENGNVLLKTIKSKNNKADTQLYNFILGGDHTYYADGYLVHNKMACKAGQVPNIAGGCEADCSFNCPSGYTKSCTGGATLCTQDYCGGYVTTYNCTGTVTGSSPTTYEGQSCNQFGTQATCTQDPWLTHGCSWNGVSTPDGVCGSATGSYVCTKQKTAATCSAISSCYWVYTVAP
ncbi:MAG: Hint domain-containing protein [Candidatus Paceibacterota bacterium]